jgi:hypothetical protein
MASIEIEVSMKERACIDPIVGNSISILYTEIVKESLNMHAYSSLTVTLLPVYD